MRNVLIVACALLLLAGAAHAAELRPFGSGEMARLLAERQGRPFALTLWSIDCPHCKGTLRQLATMTQEYPRIDLVVVNTNDLGERKTIAAMLDAVGLAQRATWVFGAAAPERLRYEIDRRWGGEMPRTYLFDADHKVAAFSGPIAPAALKEWLARNDSEPRRQP